MGGCAHQMLAQLVLPASQRLEVHEGDPPVDVFLESPLNYAVLRN